jgi:hypothetical protein
VNSQDITIAILGLTGQPDVIQRSHLRVSNLRTLSTHQLTLAVKSPWDIPDCVKDAIPL